MAAVKKGLVAMAIAALLVSGASTAHADPAEGGNAAAESLFQDARRLTDAKRYGEACPKFLASHKLSPAIGTLLNLADCYEKNGQIASAWARFHEAIALAQRLNRPDREKTARDRADKLEPRLIMLTVTSRTPNVEVKIDGEATAVGVPAPVDPGRHKLEASAVGKKSYTMTIDVSDRPQQPPIEIPALENELASGAASAPKPKVQEQVTEPPSEPRGKSGTTMRVIGLVTMGVGLAGVGVGTYFGLRTSSLWSDAEARCPALECDARGFELAGDAKSAGNISTIAFIAGGALFAGGAALFLFAPSPKVHAGLGPGSVVVGGTF